MPGGEIQLSANGSENQMLTGNPQITFFKEMYKRYTNFSMENIDVLIEGSTQLSFTGTTTMKVKIPRNGDLLKSMYLRLQLPDIYSNEDEFFWTRAVGLAMINHIDIFIGSTKVERLTGEFLDIWSQVHHSPEKRKQFQQMVGDIPELSYHEHDKFYQQFSDTDSGIVNENKFYNTRPSIKGRELHIPLEFWFMRNSSSALPLVALQYMDVEVVIEFKAVKDLYTVLEYKDDIPVKSPGTDFKNIHLLNAKRVIPTSNNHISKYLSTKMNLNVNHSLDLEPHLELNYIFLDDDERRRFASTNQEYLIEQVTYYKELGNVGTCNIEIEAYHLVKEFFFTCTRDDNDTRNEWLNYSSLEHRPIPTHRDNFEYNDDLWNKTTSLTDFIKTDGSAGTNTTSIVISSSTTPVFKYTYTTEDFIKFKSYWPYRYFEDIPKITLNNFRAYEKNPLLSCEILFQGFVRQSERKTQYFNELQAYEYHTFNLEQPINIYSFALDPESNYQPTGACNFSRLENMQLNLELVTPPTHTINNEVKNKWYYNINVFMINYNILTIASGMGGLRYAN